MTVHQNVNPENLGYPLSPRLQPAILEPQAAAIEAVSATDQILPEGREISGHTASPLPCTDKCAYEALGFMEWADEHLTRHPEEVEYVMARLQLRVLAWRETEAV